MMTASNKSVHHTYQAALGCEVCEGFDDVTWYCLNCIGRLCVTCKTNHTTAMPIFRNHQIVTLLEALQQKSAEEKWATHSSYMYSLYCWDCKKLLCNKCVSSQKHKGHVITEIKESMEKLKKEMEDYSALLRNKYLAQYDTHLSELEAIREARNSEFYIVESEIRHKQNTLKSEVDKVCNTLLERVQNENDRQLAALDNSIERAEKKMNEIFTLIETWKEAQTKFRNSEIIEFNKSKPKHNSFNIPKITPEKHVGFKPGKIDLKNISEQFRRLVALPDPNEIDPNDIPEAKIQIVSKSIQKIHVDNIEAMSSTQSLIRGSNLREMMVVNQEGTVQSTISTNFSITDFAIISPNDIVVSFYGGRSVKRIAQTGEVTVSMNTAPYMPSGVCIANSGKNIAVCVNSKDGSSGSLMIFDLDGKLQDTLKYTDRRVGSFTQQRVTQNSWADYCIAHSGQHTVYMLDKKGSLKFLYDRSNARTKDKFAPWAVCCDKSNHLLISDVSSIHILDVHGNFLRFILTEKSNILTVRELSIDKEGKLWLGQLDHGLSVLRYNLP